MTHPATARLRQALAEGALVPAESGPAMVINAAPEVDWAGLGLGALRAVQDNRAAHDALLAAGVEASVEATAGGAPTLVCITRSRRETLGLIARGARLARPGSRLFVDGQKTDGIDAHFRLLRDLLPGADSLTKAHGRLFWADLPPTLPEAFGGWEAALAPRLTAQGDFVAEGAFSADGPDAGSRMLAAHLAGLSGHVADLGAGWGYLGRAVLANPGVMALDLVEVSHAALALAGRNITDPRARFHWADARTFDPGAPLDAVVSNPPFHADRKPDPSLGIAFIAAAARMLKPRGAFWMVANRHLPYEQALKMHFGAWDVIQDDGGYKVIMASRPLRPKTGGRRP